MIRMLCILFLISGFSVGCVSVTKVQSVYDFEGRYDDKSMVMINNKRVQVPKGKSVWILTNDTLNNLLKDANGKGRK